MEYGGNAFVPIGDAIGEILRAKKASHLTARKFIIGLAAEGWIAVRAERFVETVYRLDQPEFGSFKAAWPEDERSITIYRDFWTYGLAVKPDAEASFNRGIITRQSEREWSDLPFRIRKNGGDQTRDERCQLVQAAIGVVVPLKKLLAFAEDPGWKGWAASIEAEKKRGRVPKWKWDQVKALVTIEASRSPDFLGRGVGPIVEFMIAEFRHLHFNDHPDLSEIYDYARLLIAMNGEVDEGPPS